MSGETLLAKAKEVIAAGNARRIIVKSEGGETLLEVPLTLGAVGALLVPPLAALGAVAALVTRCTMIIERREPSPAQRSEHIASDTSDNSGGTA